MLFSSFIEFLVIGSFDVESTVKNFLLFLFTFSFSSFSFSLSSLVSFNFIDGKLDLFILLFLKLSLLKAREGDVGLVGELHYAVLVAIANEDAFLGDGVPDEGHQHLAPLLGRGAPVGLAVLFCVAHLFGVGQQVLFCSLKNFLPAQAVDGNDDESGVLVALGRKHQGQHR